MADVLDGHGPGHGLAFLVGCGNFVVSESDGTLVVEVPRSMEFLAEAFALRRVLEAFKVPSTSMTPTIFQGDHIFAVKGPLMGVIEPGDVVVYKDQNGKTYVKRVIALAGQKVVETEDGIAIDGRLPAREIVGDLEYNDTGESGTTTRRRRTAVREQLGQHAFTILRADEEERTGSWDVPPGHVFVVGDNRDDSRDSRVDGPTPIENVVGRVFTIWYASSDGVPDWDRMGVPLP